jgi:hypothetical protein
MAKKRIHIQMVLSGVELEWYNALQNRSKMFRHLVNQEVALYRASVDAQKCRDEMK